jgi:hypothetical protein
MAQSCSNVIRGLESPQDHVGAIPGPWPMSYVHDAAGVSAGHWRTLDGDTASRADGFTSTQPASSAGSVGAPRPDAWRCGRKDSRPILDGAIATIGSGLPVELDGPPTYHR